MKTPELLTKGLRILLSWETNHYQIPPIQLSDRQVTLCSRYVHGGDPSFVVPVKFSGITPTQEPYDLYEFVRNQLGINQEFDLLVTTISGYKLNLPYNIHQFNCPTVAIVLDTHYGTSSPIGDLLTYLNLERYDYICLPYCRQHAHWFYACGFDNVGWLPLITMTTFFHEFVEEREAKAVFIGGDFSFHPYCAQVIENLTKLSLPIEVRSFDRITSTRVYANSLIGLNCSLNGDLNLRNLEIISSGGFLLTDQLSPQSGFTKLLTPKQDCDVYSSIEELIEKLVTI
ncbi:MAG: glycosyltransferase [Pseudanabaenaceae cyanobacterium]